MDDRFEAQLMKLPRNMRGRVYRVISGVYEQEEDTMISFIGEARRSLKIFRDEMKREDVNSLASQKPNDDRLDSARGEKQRLGAVSARHRQKSAAQQPPTGVPETMTRAALEEEVVGRVLSARSARSPRPQPDGGLEPASDLNKTTTIPAHLFDVAGPAQPPVKKDVPLSDADFKVERDEIMYRMSEEQNKLEMDKERQSAMLRKKKDKMADKQQESEVKATEMMKEASKREEIQQSARVRQEQKMKERLEKKKKKQTEDGASPVVIDVQPVA